MLATNIVLVFASIFLSFYCPRREIVSIVSQIFSCNWDTIWCCLDILESTIWLNIVFKAFYNIFIEKVIENTIWTNHDYVIMGYFMLSRVSFGRPWLGWNLIFKTGTSLIWWIEEILLRLRSKYRIKTFVTLRSN